MSAVTPGASNVAYIRQTVRELTASPRENQLTTNYLDTVLNSFYAADFPYAIKLDQMRSVYTFYTQPYIEKYPLDVDFNQGVRAPVYVDGIQGTFYKDRQEFFNLFPRWPTKFNPIKGDGVTQIFNFTIPGPFLPGNVTLGGTASGGNAIAASDDGKGNMYLQVPAPVVTVPNYPAVPTPGPFPGMLNQNTQNPGLLTQIYLGSVNYVTGAFALNFPSGYIPASPTQNYPAINLFVVQYSTGRPYCLLFWNNYFEIRPVPKLVHKIEVETYLTPVQFMLTSDDPILSQWAQYLAYGTAIEILRRRQDMAGVANLMEGFKRQEGLVLERQGTEEINQRNRTIFSGTLPNQGWNNGWNQGWF
jgi:hypothetical protein